MLNDNDVEFVDYCNTDWVPNLKNTSVFVAWNNQRINLGNDIQRLCSIINDLCKQIPKINQIESDLDPEQCSALFAGCYTNADMTEVDRVLAAYPVYRYNQGNIHQWVYSLGKCDGNTAEYLVQIITGTVMMYLR